MTPRAVNVILFCIGVVAGLWAVTNALVCLLVGAWLGALVLALLGSLAAAIAWSSYSDLKEADRAR